MRLKKAKDKESRARSGTSAIKPQKPKEASESESNSSKEDVSQAYFKKMAALKHKAETKHPHLETEQARNIYITHREVDLLNSQVKMELIATRNKLMPFIDKGFVHLSRRKKPRNLDRDLLTGLPTTPE